MAEKLDQELQRAFVIDDFETMKVLVKQGIDVNSVDARDGSSILLRAVIENDKSTVDLLLEKHADPNKSDRRKMTPLHYAALYKHIDVARALINAGAFVDAQDQGGSTPLAYAASNRRDGYLQMVKLLVAGGADADLRIKDGRSLLEFYGISLKDV
ncbi:ankyrin repeat domain-containing protein [Pararhizobium sp. PWRC1-1]|uniref:ankyrin repeat domain-containing protein n=1 Tax=Pararhizobium sp. PWRC1-1 TaxID=2804566 RepID=UPI003CEAC175